MRLIRHWTLLLSAAAALAMAGCGEDNSDIAMGLMKAGNLEGARQLIDTELAQHPNKARAHLVRGMLAVAQHEREKEIARHFNTAIMLDGDLREDIFTFVMGYVDSALINDNLASIDDITEMALEFAPMQRGKAGQVLLAKAQQMAKSNPLDQKRVFRLIQTSMECNPTSGDEVGILMYDAAVQLIEKGFVDDASLETIKSYLSGAKNVDQARTGDVSKACLKVTDVLLEDPQQAAKAQSWLCMACDADPGKSAHVGEICREAAHECFKLKRPHEAKSWLALSAKLDPASSGAVADSYLQFAKQTVSKNQLDGNVYAFLRSAYEKAPEKGNEIGRFSCTLAARAIEAEDYGLAHSLAVLSMEAEPASESEARQLLNRIPVVSASFDQPPTRIFQPVAGRWQTSTGTSGLAWGSVTGGHNLAICQVPFTTGTLEYDFKISGPPSADCDIYLDYQDSKNFLRVSLCPERGDSKDRIEIVSNGRGQVLIAKRPSIRRNHWHHARVERTNESIKVWLDGTEYLSASCRAPVTDQFALRFWDQVAVDNFTISPNTGSRNTGSTFGKKNP